LPFFLYFPFRFCPTYSRPRTRCAGKGWKSRSTTWGSSATRRCSNLTLVSFLSGSRPGRLLSPCSTLWSLFGYRPQCLFTFLSFPVFFFFSFIINALITQALRLLDHEYEGDPSLATNFMTILNPVRLFDYGYEDGPFCFFYKSCDNLWLW
jgi:hypothetical protein